MCLRKVYMGIEFYNNINFGRANTNDKLKFQENGANSDLTQRIGALLLGSSSVNVDLVDLFAGVGRTPEQKETIDQLNEKISSTGMSYADAENKIKEIRKKYNSEEYKSFFDMGGDPTYAVIRMAKELDPSKLPEPAKTEYQEATAAKEEIENNNSALAKKAGINPANNADKHSDSVTKMF